MIVYRLEHKELGCGPFRFESVDNVEEYFGEDYDDLDVLTDDLNNSMTGNHIVPHVTNLRNRVCGCESIEDILFWFSEYIDDLREFGFIINSYETFDCINKEYPKQVLFNKEEAKFLGTIHNLSCFCSLSS